VKRAPKPPPPQGSSITRMSPDLTCAPVIVGIEAVNSSSSIARPIPVPLDRCILLSRSDELLRLACRRCLLRVCPARASSIVHISADEAAIARKTPIKKGGYSLLFKISFRRAILDSIRSAKEPQITRGRRLLRFQRVSANESSDSDLSWTAITPSKTSRSGSWCGLLRSMLDYGQYPVSRETSFESRGLLGDHRPSIWAGLREPGGKMSGVKRIRF